MLGLDTLQRTYDDFLPHRWEIPFLGGLAWLLFTVVTAGGFLWLVGIHPYATALAFAPSGLFMLGLVCFLSGGVWSGLSESPDIEIAWQGWLGQGAQLYLYHTLWAAFVLSLGYLMLPWGALLVLGYLLLLPMASLTMVLSAQNPNFLGLLESAFRVFQVPLGRLILLWAELFGYHLFWGGLIMPLVCFGLLLSVVGIPLIPVVAVLFAQGGIRLAQNALDEVESAILPSQPLAPQPAYSQATWPMNPPEGFRQFNRFRANPPE